MAAGKKSGFEILFWIVILILILMILTRIFGHSATDIQIYLTIVIIMITIMGYITKINREVGEIKTHMMNSFNKIKCDIDELKSKISKK